MHVATVQRLYITNQAEHNEMSTLSPTDATLVELDGTASGSTSPSTPTRMIFVEDRPARIRCVAVGGYPAPSLALFLGDHDVTELVGGGSAQQATTPTITTTIVVSGSSSRAGSARGRPGLRTIMTRVELGWPRDNVERIGVHRPSAEQHNGRGNGGGRNTAAFVVGKNDDGSRLRCVATVPGLRPNVTETVIDVHCKCDSVVCVCVQAWVLLVRAWEAALLTSSVCCTLGVTI